MKMFEILNIFFKLFFTLVYLTIREQGVKVFFMKLKKSIVIIGILLIAGIISGFVVFKNRNMLPAAVVDSPNDGEKIEYDYSKSVSECVAMEDEIYFKDAVFVGDSRTEGFMNLTHLDSTFYTHIGLTVDTFFSDPIVYMDGEKVSIEEALKNTAFKKVYIMLGINETGWQYSELFKRKYGEIIDTIRKINPNVLIYIESILPVSQEISETHSYIKQEKINEYNTLLQDLAREKEVYYIDIASSMKNEEGFLPTDAAIDGIHLNKEYALKWLQYLKNHYIVENTQKGDNEQ